MKRGLKSRSVLTLALLVSVPAAASAASALSPRERAVVVAARHLLTSIGTPALASAVRDRSLRTDAYWQRVFASARASALYPELASELQRAMNDVPLVNGRPAEPDVYARAVLRGIGPMPMTPLTESGEEERRAVLAFARERLSVFSKVAYSDPIRAEQSAAEVARAARAVFKSAAIAEAFARMGTLISEGEPSRVDLVDTKDRLNEYLHPYGLHLVLDASDLNAGKANLASYVILSKHAFSILGKPFVVYEARPSIDSHTTSALGHAEIEPGYMFIFANHVDKETEAGLLFAGGASLGLLWRGVDDNSPLPGISADAVRAVEGAVRDRVREGTGLAAERYRTLLINTIGRHEGFHMYIEPGIANAVRRGKISRSMAATWHENGAYLYQLEVGDPRFVHMDLLMLLMVAANGNPNFPDNTAGARAAMNDLQGYLPATRFWHATEHRPVESGVAALFRLPPEEIKKAASQARWAYEVVIRN